MIIGKGFNENCKKLLIVACNKVEKKVDQELSVTELNDEFNFDRNEMKNYLEYLNDKKLIEIKSIGGTMLYGHITITKRGINKIIELQKKGE